MSILCKDYDHDYSANLMKTKVNEIVYVYSLTVLLTNHILLDYNYINVIIVWLLMMMMMWWW